MTPFSVGRRREGADLHPPNIVAVLFMLVPALAGVAMTVTQQNPVPAIAGIVVGIVLMQAPKVAQQWERGIVLRLGRFRHMRGPGLFFVVPFIDSITA